VLAQPAAVLQDAGGFVGELAEAAEAAGRCADRLRARVGVRCGAAREVLQRDAGVSAAWP
jgi:hypothetical protein